MMANLTDEDLIARFRDRGDRDALLELVSRYQGPIYNYLLGRLGSPQRAEEAAQETFLRMLRGLPGYRAELPFRPWLYRIALNAGRTLLEQGRVRARKEQEASVESNGRRTAVDPAENALHQEVHAALHELPDEQKEALTLHYAQGLSHAEVAGALGVPPGTAATRIHQGLQSLRSRFRAIEALAIEQVLGNPKVLAAPKSILKIVAAEAAKAVPAVAGAAALVTAGGAVNTKTGILIATAILCLAAGGVVGYQVRGTRVAAEAPADAASARAGANGPERGGGERRERAALPATDVAQAPLPTPEVKPAPARAGSAATSRMRKLAANFAEEERAWAQMKDRRHPTKEEEAKVQAVAAKMFTDPELMAIITPGKTWTVDEKTEFTLAFLEEMGFPAATADQAEAIRKAIADWARVADSPLDHYSSKVEKRIAEVRENAALFESLKSILSKDQQPGVRSLEQSGFVGLSETRPAGFVLSPPGPAQAATYVLNSWSKQIVELDEPDRTRLAAAASAHAERLWNAQAELQAKYGDPYIRFLSDTLKASALTQDVEALIEATRNGGAPKNSIQDYKAAHPAWETELREGYLRLLQAEKENREALIALLPAKAGSIQKAKPYVYLFSTSP
ncbi:MAG TPA: RNA polymerase sigma factor [Planctomycetota bacterium]|jgi:RNA polymerase sigma-70 factor (ECF subfamily)|nr:RNA polymerase sigma factor [Planctomycetota bacterium]